MKLRGIVLLSVAVCGLAWAGAPDAATPPLTPLAVGETDELHATKFAPVAYFNQNCARCHGENGSFYEEDFAAGQTDAHLREAIDEMAEGPGQAPLTPAELDAVAAFHRALRDKKPFVAIVKAEKVEAGWQLSGEISPGATLEIKGENVEVKGTEWTFCVADASSVKLRASRGDATTELDANVAALAP